MHAGVFNQFLMALTPLIRVWPEVQCARKHGPTESGTAAGSPPVTGSRGLAITCLWFRRDVNMLRAQTRLCPRLLSSLCLDASLHRANERKRPT